MVSMKQQPDRSFCSGEFFFDPGGTCSGRVEVYDVNVDERDHVNIEIKLQFEAIVANT